MERCWSSRILQPGEKAKDEEITQLKNQRAMYSPTRRNIEGTDGEGSKYGKATSSVCAFLILDSRLNTFSSLTVCRKWNNAHLLRPLAFPGTPTPDALRCNSNLWIHARCFEKFSHAPTAGRYAVGLIHLRPVPSNLIRKGPALIFQLLVLLQINSLFRDHSDAVPVHTPCVPVE